MVDAWAFDTAALKWAPMTVWCGFAGGRAGGTNGAVSCRAREEVKGEQKDQHQQQHPPTLETVARKGFGFRMVATAGEVYYVGSDRFRGSK